MSATTNIYFIAKYKIKGVDQLATLKECLTYLKTQKTIGIDIETSKKFKEGTYNERIYKGGLDPYLSNIVMLQVGTLEKVFVIDVRDFSNKELKPITDFLNYNEDILLVAHNAKFEGKHLKHKYGIRLRKIWDTMIVELNLTNGLPFKYGLANLAERYLDVKLSKEASLFGDLYDKKEVTLNDEYIAENEHILTPYEIEDNFQLDKSTRMQFVKIGKKQFTKEQVLYGADDITFPLLIRERQLLGRKLPSGEIYNPIMCHKIENTFTQVLADIELEGIGFDPVKWDGIANKNAVIFLERKEELEDFVISEFPYHTALPDLFRPKPSCKVDWASSTQVVYFFRQLEICPKEVSKQTKKLDWTVGADALLKVLPNEFKAHYAKNNWIGFEKDKKGKYVIDKDRLILAYLLLKKTEQAITTFGKEWLKYVHPITGRVHSSFRQIMNTGRMSSNSPNIQNISNGEYRDCFIAREGMVMLNADYSAQEIRVVADKTQDPAFVDFFLKGDETFGDDFHAYTATKMYKIMENNPELLVPPKELPNGDKNPAFKEEHNEKRGNAKAINFKINYGGTAFTLKDDLGAELEVAEMFIKTYFDAFPTLEESFKKSKKEAVEQGYVLIDKYSDRRWFCPYFEEMEDLYEDIKSYYPDGYFEGAYKGDKVGKARIKEDLYETYPFIKDMWKEYFRWHGQLERAGLNYPTQGTSAMIMKMSMNILRHQLIDQKITDFVLTNLVHDEALAESSKESAKRNGKILSDAMVLGGNYFCKTIPMKATTIVSDVWKH